MTDSELIARQAKMIEELRDENEDLKMRSDKAIRMATCIGGPLNGNLKGYTKPQMADFQRIVDLLGGNS